jgi:phosphoribosyl 1,2-cyclic phosphate phosphodiesterase
MNNPNKNKTKLRFTVLGCGGSPGVPLITGYWGSCNPANPKNRRLRASALLEYNNKVVVIDTSPDLRQQLLRQDVCDIDTVLYTHAHADHCHGIDELRPLYFFHEKRAMPIYVDKKTLEELQTKFGYLFPTMTKKRPSQYPTLVEPHTIEPYKPFDIFGKSILPIAQNHGFQDTLGFRIGDVTYSTDVLEFDDRAFEAMAGTKIWFVDCLRRCPHKTHTHLEKTLSWIERLKPERAILIHMDHTMDYESLRKDLPPNIEPAYDGMVIETEI